MTDIAAFLNSDLIKNKPFSLQSRAMEISGHIMHYIDEGQGPVVFLLHGNPTWCFYYRSLIEKLKANFRVIVPDYIGCGLSSSNQDDHFRASQRVAHLQELVQKLKRPDR